MGRSVNGMVSSSSPQVQCFLSQLAEVVHLSICNLDQILVLQGFGTQFKQLKAEDVLVRFPLLGQVTQGLHGLQKAVNRTLGHHDPLGQLSHPYLFLLSQCLLYAKNLEDGLHRVWIVIYHRHSQIPKI